MNIKNQVQSNEYSMGFIRKSTIWVFMSLLLYKIVLDLSYYFIISKIWAYYKLGLNFNGIKLIESFFLLFIIFILMPKTSKKLSNIIIWLLIILSYVPMLTLFALKNESRIYMYAITAFWILIFLLLKMNIPMLSITLFNRLESKTISYAIFAILTFISIILIYNYFAFQINLNLTTVYNARTYYKGLKMPFFSVYCFNWTALIVNPLFFILFFNNKKWINLILIIFVQLFLFTATGHKTYLFAIPFVFVLQWIITRKNSFFLMAIILIGIMLLGILSYLLMDDVLISSLFTVRTLLIPANLSFFYYDYFSKELPIFFSYHRIFRNFLSYPYHLSPPYLIAEYYFNDPIMCSNNGIYSDAYMNFGFIGFVFWGIFLTIIMRIIDRLAKNKDIRLTISCIALPVISLINAPLLTDLLTHGLLISLIFLYLLPKEKDKLI